MLLTLGGLGIWTLIDLLKILLGKFRDAQGQLITNPKPVLSWSILLALFVLVSAGNGKSGGSRPGVNSAGSDSRAKIDGTYGGRGGESTVYIKSAEFTMIAKTGVSVDYHKGKILSKKMSPDRQIVEIAGDLRYGRGESRASYEAGLTGSSKETYYTSPFSATIDLKAKTINVKAELIYAGSRYSVDETLPEK